VVNQLETVLVAALLTLSLALAGCDSGREMAANSEKAVVDEVTYEARFTEEGELIRPDNWREWIWVAMPVTPNALNGGKAILPEAQAVYLDPTSWKHWRKTGAFRDGTMFAVELTTLMSEGAHDDGSTSQTTGRGFFQDQFSGLQFAIKDQEQFADEPGNWAYFSSRIGAGESEYPETMAALPTEACNSCHATHGGQDWVFTQLYPVLRAAKSAGTD
jgi:hypothetical protein